MTCTLSTSVTGPVDCIVAQIVAAVLDAPANPNWPARTRYTDAELRHLFCAMQSHVFGLRHHFQILNAIVVSLLVHVMNYLIALKIPTNRRLNNQPVLGYVAGRIRLRVIRLVHVNVSIDPPVHPLLLFRYSSTCRVKALTRAVARSLDLCPLYLIFSATVNALLRCKAALPRGMRSCELGIAPTLDRTVLRTSDLIRPPQVLRSAVDTSEGDTIRRHRSLLTADVAPQGVTAPLGFPRVQNSCPQANSIIYRPRIEVQ